MAFPVVAGSQTSQQTTNSTSSNVTLPANIQAGDLIIAFVAADSGAGAMTWPSPWVEIKDDAGTGFQFSVGYLIASGGETTVAVTHGSERSNHLAIRITGWHGTTPPEITAVASGSSTTPNPGSLSPSWGAADTLWIAVLGCDNTTTDPFPITAWPTNYDSNHLSNNTATSAADVAIATRELNATSDDPGTFTMTGTETWNAYTIAVRPAASADFTLSGGVAFGWSEDAVGEETFSASGGSTYVFSEAGVGEETFSATGATAFGFSEIGDAIETFEGSGSLVFGWSEAGTAEVVQNVLEGGVAFGFSEAGTGEETFSATGATAYPFAIASTGEESFIATGATAFGFAEAGVAEESFSASGAVAFGFALAGVATVSNELSASGGVAFAFALAGSGTVDNPPGPEITWDALSQPKRGAPRYWWYRGLPTSRRP